MHRFQRGRGFTIGVAAGIAVPVAVLLAFSLLGGSSGPSRDDVEADLRLVSAYEADLKPLVDQGASVVVYGMRPGIADISDGRFDDATLVNMAEGWVGSMRKLRDEFAAVETPDFLEPAAERYDRSLAAYVDTAQALVAAAKASGGERRRLVTRAAGLGERADDLFDEADAEVDRQRARLEDLLDD